MQRKYIYLAAIVLVAALFGYWISPKPKHSDRCIILYGNVDIRQVELSFRVDGRIAEVFVDEGDPVSKGQLVATLEKQPYQDEMSQADANVKAIEPSLENAEKLYQRRLVLHQSGAVSQEDFEDSFSNRNVLQANLESALAALGTAQTNLQDTHVYAPTEGWVLTRIREPGSVVKEGDPVLTISVKSPLWVRAYVDEPQLGLIYPNMPARVFTDTKGGKIYHGKIGFISPMAEFTPKTVETTELRTDLVYRLRIMVEDPDEGLRQGMPVTVQLERQQP